MARALEFIRERGLLSSIFRAIGWLWRSLFRLLLLGAILRFIWLILFGQRSRRRRKPSEEAAETLDAQQ